MKPTRNFTKAVSEGGKKVLPSISNEAFARLLAQEYIRNGMNVNKAYVTLTGCSQSTADALALVKMARGHADTFVDEIKVQMANANIEMDAVLNQLWTMLQTSLLDFFGEDGKMLSIRELKKLPRCVQAIIHTIEVKSIEKPVLDAGGMVMVDDNGRPYLRNEQRVKIVIPNKLDAIRQLAALMKWVGPETVVNINVVNVGGVMASADDRRRRLERVYESTPAPVRPDLDDSIA